MKDSEILSAALIERARWIWAAGEGEGQDLYRMLRLPVTLTAEGSERAAVAVTADSRYVLFINGRQVGRGPARCAPWKQCLDHYDIASYLRPGPNVIAALVHHLGRGNGQYIKRRPGFFLAGRAGAKTLCTGEADWQIWQPQCWASDGWQTNPHLGYNEDIAMELLPEDWRNSSAEPAHCRPLEVEVVQDAQRLWPAFERRDIPQMAGRYMGPRGVVATGCLPATRRLSLRDLLDAPRDSFPGSYAFEQGRLRFWAGGDVPVYFILDFGQEVVGYPDVEISSSAPAEVGLVYAEKLSVGGRIVAQWHSPQPASAQEPWAVFEARHGGEHADRLRLKRGRNVWRSSFNLRAFRYLLLVFTNPSAIETCRAGVHVSHYPLGSPALFKVGEPQLERMWDVSARTIAFCMHDAFVDCPWREQQQYGGDTWLEALFSYRLFDDTRLVRRFLTQYAEGMSEEGEMQSCFPACWDQVIPSWTLAWVESIADYYRQTGDFGPAGQLADKVRRALRWFERFRGHDGLLHVEEEFGWSRPTSARTLWNFIEWPDDLPRYQKDLLLSLQYAAALNRACGLYAAHLPDETLHRWQTASAQTTAALRAFLRSDGRAGVCVESSRFLAAALKAEVPAREQRSLYLRRLAEQARSGRLDVEFCYLAVALRLLVRAGYWEEALLALRRVYGAMLEQGATTWFETTDALQRPGRSLCHGWAAAPADILPAIYAGVEPVRPGFDEFEVAPRCIPEGTTELETPTPKGRIHAHFRREGENLTVQMDAPAGTRCARILIPAGAELCRIKAPAASQLRAEKGRFVILRPGQRLNAELRLTT